MQALLDEESPDVFLAKATLQQYLSRVVRRDWSAARLLTHPKTLAAIAQVKKRTGSERHHLAPWAEPDAQLKTFRFAGAREVSPGVVLVEVGEDTWRRDDDAMSVDVPSVYLLFKSRGGFLVADKKVGIGLRDVSDRAVRLGFAGYLDHQVQAQARRESTLFAGRHR